MFHGKISLIFVLLLLLVNFEWVQTGIDVYTPYSKSQVNSHSSAWFLATCAAVMIQRFFFCNNRIKLLNLKESSEKLVIVAKGFLKLPNFPMLLKQKSLSLPRNLALETFGKLLIVFSTKVNLLYLCYSKAWRCCLLHLIKQNCLLKLF